MEIWQRIDVGLVNDDRGEPLVVVGGKALGTIQQVVSLLSHHNQRSADTSKFRVRPETHADRARRLVSIMTDAA